MSNPLLVKANRACEFLQQKPDSPAYRRILLEKARLHVELGQHTSALAALRHAAEFFATADQRGLVTVTENSQWIEVVSYLGTNDLDSQQRESAKGCFLRLLTWPLGEDRDRVHALQRLATLYKQRMEWVKVIECCEQGLTIVSRKSDDSALNESVKLQLTEERLLLLLADAAEGLGDMLRAQECDEKAKKVWFDAHPTAYFTELMTCDRREALMHLAAGKPLEAVRCLARAPELYLDRFKHAGLNLIEVSVLRPIMDALKVLADALAQTDNQKYVVHGRRIRADVEETEAILAGYWEGVLEETR